MVAENAKFPLRKPERCSQRRRQASRMALSWRSVLFNKFNLFTINIPFLSISFYDVWKHFFFWITLEADCNICIITEDKLQFASCSNDQSILLWQAVPSTQSMKPLICCRGHEEMVNCISLSANNKWVCFFIAKSKYIIFFIFYHIALIVLSFNASYLYYFSTKLYV